MLTMPDKDAIVACKILYTLVWVFLATYYFSWGENQVTVTAPIDESGWVPDGALTVNISHSGDMEVEEE